MDYERICKFINRQNAHPHCVAQFGGGGKPFIDKGLRVLKPVFPSNKFGFTLSEILITLVIIGVIYVLVISPVIKKQQERSTVVRVQKAYSVLNQAYLQSVEEYGVPSTWGINNARNIANAVVARDKILKYVKVSKLCSNSQSQEDCGIAKNYKYIDGKTTITEFKKSASAMITNGIGVAFITDQSAIVKVGNSSYINNMRGTTPALQYTSGWILVDINGKKGPNRYSKDVFLFYFTDYGIIPLGTPEEVGGIYSYNIDTTCSTTGLGCTAWVLRQKNMNYLHSNKCSWTNTSCK